MIGWRQRGAVLLVAGCLIGAPGVRADQDRDTSTASGGKGQFDDLDRDVAGQPLMVEPPPGAKDVSVWSAVLWYVPNRFMDAVDIFRLRVKAGPGFGVTARLTDYAAFYAGNQRTVFFGLPGPRYPDLLRWPVVFENQKGLVVAGVDASDELSHPPHYGFSEADVGLHLGLIGVEAGLDPFEIADFIAGVFLFDLRSDDYPRTSTPLPERGRVMARKLSGDVTAPDARPKTFSGSAARLDYLETEVPRRLRGQMQTLDARFAKEGQEVLVQPPMDELSIGFYVRTIVGSKTKVEFKPDINLDVDLPNLERRVSLFVESASSDDLPGRDKLDRNDKGFSVGARSKKNVWDISTDVGVRARWLPEVFVRAAWKPEWSSGEWKWNFEQRVFWESDDGFGALSSLATHRWFSRERWIYRQNTSGKISEETDGFEWEQSVSVGRVYQLFDEHRRTSKRRISASDALSGYGFKASVFGSDDELDQGRLQATYRFALYKQFVVGEIRAGPQWRESQDWDTEARFDFGLQLHF